MGNGIRDQDLGALCAHNYWLSLVLGPFNRQEVCACAYINAFFIFRGHQFTPRGFSLALLPPSTVRTLAPNHTDTFIHLSGPVIHLK